MALSSLLGLAPSPGLHSFSKGLQTRPCGLLTRCDASKGHERSMAGVERRSLLGGTLGLSLATLLAPEALAGPLKPGANVFGPAKSKRTDFIAYNAESFALLVPSKWNPASSKGAYPGIVLKYEDNGDQGNNLEVVKRPTSKRSITEYGDPKKFLQEIKFIFGDNVWQGSTISEGGFKKDQVYSTSLINIDDSKDKNGNEYYRYEMLNRTADGTAGGTHILLSAAVNEGQLHIFKVQILDKRWVRGADKDGKGAFKSFVVV
ncbi:hypothetical protein WJX84_003469 [Apatococcus fuscideae]|uniref:PsbP C-terminal domain-containing protein n=1 Tax=Apatococcus fuscideae TaxID=2026836 RepID=A0AAW1TDE9_9CHLO